MLLYSVTSTELPTRPAKKGAEKKIRTEYTKRGIIEFRVVYTKKGIYVRNYKNKKIFEMKSES